MTSANTSHTWGELDDCTDNDGKVIYNITGNNTNKAAMDRC